MNHLIRVTKSDGTTQLFEEEKLINSLKRVGASEAVIDDVVTQVESEMTDGMRTVDIYKRAFNLIRKHSAPVAVKYSIRRAMFELGPDGFPFEKFVARIFKLWGYESVIDQHLMGKCVEHEVDVVAWKENNLAMAEVKFHNEFGLKSDVKVSLYVKARFDDLSETVFDYGNVKMKLTDRYLFTNTKFTEAAILYGKCQGINLISWNYPHDLNLHRIIEDNALYPVTCLTSLDHRQKSELLRIGIIVVCDIKNNPGCLKAANVPPSMHQVVLEEVEMIHGLKSMK
jgi:hypothetical protein